MRHLNVLLGRLVNRSTLLRCMRISSSRAELIMKEIRHAVGREAVLVGARTGKDGAVVHTVQLIVYRLEEVTLTDLIQTIDPGATVDVLRVPVSRTEGIREKRHNRDDLPDVSKYGNELS